MAKSKHTERVLALLDQIDSPDLSEIDTDAPAEWQKKLGKKEDIGDFEEPSLQPKSLVGVSLVFTGDYERISREEAVALVKKFGAKAPSSISGSTSVVVVVGDSPGPSKIKKVLEKGIKALDEDGFFQFLALVEELPEPDEEEEEEKPKKKKATKAKPKPAKEAKVTKPKRAKKAKEVAT
ncbi:hypothetical protein DICA4_D17106 [Diutina catenulata]